MEATTTQMTMVASITIQDRDIRPTLLREDLRRRRPRGKSNNETLAILVDE
jgi:hypothetical protein